ncbi:lipase [Staphylococcus warneri]|uniref:Lipase n=1 Tax=Staphylococcus warneri TaxID=1292 RepID=A0A2T4PXG7_STAWA|nr:lipase [Staphylococcus warneri]PTI14083.1 lipase [Staphylococcus warneri]PTI17421.1 lipase [Staphylococcus warneri]PTI22140.1 lipase [Staphylococcus warneri]PTI34600.1 lipase [Staphylococcus warneri]PTI49453.1 lipase [Staphylococcus warneri]
MKYSNQFSQDVSRQSYDNLIKGDKLKIADQDYKVVEKRDDTENGLRAYAFAPVKNGKADTSHIYMGYAGTDIGSFNDLKTDVQLPFYHIKSKPNINDHYKKLKNSNINKKYNDFHNDNDMFDVASKGMREPFDRGTVKNAKYSPSQMDESVAFTEAVANKYGNKNIDTSAHSLGAYIAALNTVKHNLNSATTYGGPNPYGAFSGQFKNDIDSGKYDNKITNIGHDDDVIFGLTFNNPRIGKSRIAMYNYNGLTSRLPGIGQHSIKTYNDFYKNGNAKTLPEEKIAEMNKNNMFSKYYDPYGMDKSLNKLIGEEERKRFKGTPTFDHMAIAYKEETPIGPVKKRKHKVTNKDKDLPKEFDPLKIDWDNDDDIGPTKKNADKLKNDKESETKKGSKHKSKSSHKVKGEDSSSVKKGKGGSGGSGKTIKIQPDEVRDISNQLRDRLNLFDSIINALEEYKRETKIRSNQILDQYKSELLSGSHEFISPSDLEEYMEQLAQEGDSGNFKFYDSGLMEELIQDIHQNKKELQQFAEKLEFAADKFEEKDLEESDVYGLFG